MNKKNIYNGETVPKEDVIKIVCEELFTTFEELKKFNRKKPNPDNRKILSYCLKKYCGTWATCVNVGRLFNRDHATILHGWKRSEDFILTDPVFRKKLATCCAQIENLNNKNPYKVEKTVNELFKELVDSQIITERHKLRLLLAVEKQKEEALETLRKVIEEQKTRIN
tara:strand:+ start:163 stop:666 length:504 start_codon:yes stop_codon:yes gene_type:complete